MNNIHLLHLSNEYNGGKNQAYGQKKKEISFKEHVYQILSFKNACGSTLDFIK